MSTEAGGVASRAKRSRKSSVFKNSTLVRVALSVCVAAFNSYLNLHCFTGNSVRYSRWRVNH